MSPEKLQKYIEYYENKIPGCEECAWTNKYKLRMLKEEQRLPHVYDGCMCLSGFGLAIGEENGMQEERQG
jgi:hypothetical protein